MDYEKVYRNALKKAQEGKPIEEIFPELKKSKDKIMSEAAIQLINGCGYLYAIIDGLNIDKNDVIAWLEKQGEQKPTKWSEEDERLQQCLISDQEKCLEEVRNDKVGHSEIISDLKEMYHERIDWLESLKKRIKGE